MEHPRCVRIRQLCNLLELRRRFGSIGINKAAILWTYM
jgi:hypothetical protein